MSGVVIRKQKHMAYNIQCIPQQVAERISILA